MRAHAQPFGVVKAGHIPAPVKISTRITAWQVGSLRKHLMEMKWRLLVPDFLHVNSCKSQVYLHGIKENLCLLNKMKFDDWLDFLLKSSLQSHYLSLEIIK